jgi:hypothetical protein
LLVKFIFDVVNTFYEASSGSNSNVAFASLSMCLFQHRTEIRRKIPVWKPRLCQVLGDVFIRDERQHFSFVPMVTRSEKSPQDLITIRFDNQHAGA